jgi:hypothetical protein
MTAKHQKYIYFIIFARSCATTNMTFQSAIIYQQKIKQLTTEEQLHQLSKRDCTSPVQRETPFRSKQKPEIFNKCLLHY